MSEAPATITTVPAAPGWYVRYYIKGTEEHPSGLTYDPIVAWEIERVDRPYHPSAKRYPGERLVSRYAYPVLLESECSNRYVVQDPSGRLHEPDGASFITEADAIAYFEGEGAL